jgi:tellurium resistance protein TerD
MTVHLSKGQTAKLDIAAPFVLVGFGWDCGREFAIDASAFICAINGHVRSDEDFVFYGNLDWNDRTIWSTGVCYCSEINDDEAIYVDFNRLPEWVDKIVFTITIYDAKNRRQTFGQIGSMYVRVARAQNEFDAVGENMVRFDIVKGLTDETALVVCELCRNNNEWEMKAIADGNQGDLEMMCQKYGVLV